MWFLNSPLWYDQRESLWWYRGGERSFKSTLSRQPYSTVHSAHHALFSYVYFPLSHKPFAVSHQTRSLLQVMLSFFLFLVFPLSFLQALTSKGQVK